MPIVYSVGESESLNCQVFFGGRVPGGLVRRRRRCRIAATASCRSEGCIAQKCVLYIRIMYAYPDRGGKEEETENKKTQN